ncbi:MAG: hypothetical protein JNM69_19910 [Archangium sp.]|nr:hypothetical protein [Archangium sp.]
MNAETQQQIETLRARVAADPRTKAIAKNLNLSVQDYAGLVAHFKVTGEEPQFMVASDEVLRQHGVQVPSAKQVEGFLRAEKTVIEKSGRTSSFDDLPRVQVREQPAAPATPVDPKLNDALKRSIKRNLR